MKKRLIIIAGATGVGKTNVSLKLADALGTEIISADSRQLYRYLDIGTAKPTTEQLHTVKHHLINCLDPAIEYSAGDFEREALAIVNQLFEDHDFAIVSGGTGFYIEALRRGLDLFPKVPAEVRAELNSEYLDYGINHLQEQLITLDPVYARIVDINNPHRLIRALSVIRSSGKPYSSFLSKEKEARNFQVLPILLTRHRRKLYERINNRVDEMMQLGFVNEVKSLYSLKHLSALRTLGYKEIINYLEGEISLETAVELMKQNTRRYAKRQITWNCGHGPWYLSHPERFSEIYNIARDSKSVMVN